LIDLQADAAADPNSARRVRTGVGTLAVITFLSVVGLWLRWRVATNGGFWRDEGLAMFVAKLPSWNAMLNFLQFHESHPPLFYALMRIWMSVFGDTDTRSVVPAVVSGVALIPTVFVVGQSLFSERVGLVAAAFVAFSPALVEYSGSARPYSLMPLLTVISCYSLLKASQNLAWRLWALYAASTLLLVYVHNWSWLIVMGQWAALLAVLRAVESPRRNTVARQWLVTQAIIAIAYGPWIRALIYQTRLAGHAPSLIDVSSDPVFAFVIDARKFLESTILGSAHFTPQQADDWVSWLLPAPLLFLPLVQLLFLRNSTSTKSERRRTSDHDVLATRSLLIVPIVVFLIAIVLSPRSELMLTRCLVALAPLLLLALAAWLGRERGHLLYRLSVLTIGSFLLTYGISLSRLLSTSRSNARELAMAVSERAHSTDLVVVSPEWIASSFNRYFAASVEQIDFPSFRREGAVDFAGFLDRFRSESSATRARQRLNEASTRGRRVWLVIDGRLIRVDSTSLQKLLGSRSYSLVATARTAQLRFALDSLYGPPDTIVAGREGASRYESLRALLYSAR
jgi:4-amino-4-deoxy-L-arabinose transferase-like glycosyltransferase